MFHLTQPQPPPIPVTPSPNGSRTTRIIDNTTPMLPEIRISKNTVLKTISTLDCRHYSKQFLLQPHIFAELFLNETVEEISMHMKQQYTGSRAKDEKLLQELGLLLINPVFYNDQFSKLPRLYNRITNSY